MDFNYIKNIDVEVFLRNRYKMIPKRKTSNNLFYECPWHNDTDASLCYSLTRKKFTCFGPDKFSGDIIDFVQCIENVTNKEACNIICEDSKLPKPLFKPENPFHSEYKQIMTSHAIRYCKSLMSNQKAITYLLNRGITTTTMKRFFIGVTDKEEFKIRTDIGGISNRISFPILDSVSETNGIVCVGMGYRTIENDNVKYINDRSQIGAKDQNPNYVGAFEKGSYLFGQAQAKKSIAENKYAFVVEGYFDVISLVQAGIENVVGAMGSTITEAQIDRLGTNNVILLFDGDVAGLDSMQSNVIKLLSKGKSVSVVVLPNGYDPAELCVAKSFNTKEILNVIQNNVVTGVSYVISRNTKDYENAVIKKRTEALDKSLAVIDCIPDETLKIVYRDLLYKKLDIRL